MPLLNAFDEIVLFSFSHEIPLQMHVDAQLLPMFNTDEKCVTCFPVLSSIGENPRSPSSGRTRSTTPTGETRSPLMGSDPPTNWSQTCHTQLTGPESLRCSQACKNATKELYTTTNCAPLISRSGGYHCRWQQQSQTWHVWCKMIK